MDKKRLWPAIVSIVGALAAVFADPIHAWVAENAEMAVGIGSILTIIANFTKAPSQE